MTCKFNNTCTIFNKNLTLFDELSLEQQKLIEANKVTVTYKKGETICKQGAFASHIMHIKKGLAKVYLEGDASNLILKIAPSNSLIGMPAIYEGNNTFIYSVTTYTESTVDLIDMKVFKDLLQENAKFAFRTLNIMNENIIQIYGRFFCLSNKQLHGRIADILMCLKDRVYKKNKFEFSFSRSELAELTNMSTESVIRVMKNFKDDGLIHQENKTLQILNPDMLNKISSLG
ncbi:Crp/Fnr family transcriptional regulator [Ancylomarina longa]|uniref:Crp/Fnr family transcriptional regulator n=1 Tax=Ancylomarina longa TaxID=2487017 RepID=A0A434AZA2_9BACT|nr:Crp/Fnr family transcriptional regulator [Ancylomarina longa]RUT79951.1 Crp/Fnr family transcriptional regulator [Ancylomarina longa]